MKSDNPIAGTRFSRLVCLLAALTQLSTLNSQLAAATITFTTNTVISEANAAFDGQDIIVSAATLTGGRHYFNSLLLTNGAVLTDSDPPSGSRNQLKAQAHPCKVPILSQYPL